jgi:hypothetical protein
VAHGALASLVAFRHGVPVFVLLHGDRRVLPEVGKDLRGSGFRQGQGKVGEFGPVISHENALGENRKGRKGPKAQFPAALQHGIIGLKILHISYPPIAYLVFI